MYSRLAICTALLPLLTACAPSKTTEDDSRPPGVVQIVFDSLFHRVTAVPLMAPPSEPIGVIRGIAVTPEHFILADLSNANLKVFNRQTGAHVRTIGRAGNGPGEFRRISSLELDEKGRLVTLDAVRGVLAIRDTAGTMIREQQLLGGFSDLALLPGLDRFLLAGRVGAIRREGGGPAVAVPEVIHEVDSAGIQASYLPTPWPQSQWQMSFANFFLVVVGAVSVAGSYNATYLTFRDRSSGRIWTSTVSAPWLRPLNWPKDETYGPGTKLEQVDRWVRDQTLVQDLFPIVPDRLIVAVQAYGTDGDRRWGYVVGGVDGGWKTASSLTRSQILRTVGDTAFAIVSDPDGNPTVETRILRVPSSR